MGRFIDITGWQFGKLIAVRHLSNSYWLCKCECGNWKTTRSGDLKRGQVKSCGCIRRAQNKFDLCDDDCLNCPYPDCIKPDYLCTSIPEVKR